MGAHFSPPFAIIFMHELESKALSILKNKLEIIPKLYARYNDDIIFGPFERNSNIFKKILDVFNSIDDNIQFTMEIPNNDKPLNFLDISITINNNTVDYEWYRKDCHSGILLKEDSFIPTHMKDNFINNSIKKIENNCATELATENKINEFEDLLKDNGYSQKQIQRTRQKRERRFKHKRQNKRGIESETCKKTPLVLNYINDNANRKINQLINKYDLEVRLVSKPGPALHQVLNKADNKVNSHTCEICKNIGSKSTCEQRFVVYQFTCQICGDSYIGQTARPFKFRYNEHKYSIN